MDFHPRSSAASFITAPESLSSSLSPPPSTPPPPETVSPDNEAQTQWQEHSYRPSRELPFELREYCIICFEESLYSPALSLLTNLLVSDCAVSSPTESLPAFTPPSSHLALAATLAVHPNFTTQTSSIEKLRAANEALLLLRHVNRIVGPVNADLCSAFSFPSLTSSRRGSRRRGPEPENGQGNHEEDGAIDTELANAGSLWARADDWWHIVGWAFNCSVLWKKRWERWKVFLEFMLDVMEDDLAQRAKLKALSESTNDSTAQDVLEESLVVRYLTDVESRTKRRRIMRAICADGSSKSVSEFHEVFSRETVERKKDEQGKVEARPQINLDEGNYGDYDLSDDEDADMRQGEKSLSTRSTRVSASAKQSLRSNGADGLNQETGVNQDDKPLVGAEKLGGIESLGLRQRFLRLLYDVSLILPHRLTPPDDLFDLYTEFLRPLPVDIFSLFLSTSVLDHEAQSCLDQMLLRPLLATTTPTHEIPNLTQLQLQQIFLPYPATGASAADNAKVSLVLENLLLLVYKTPGLRATKELRKAVKDGIKAREGKVAFDGRRRAKDREVAAEDDLFVLKASGERLKTMLDLVEA